MKGKVHALSVPSEIIVSEELERTLTCFYIRMHRGHEQKHRNQDQYVPDIKSISSEKQNVSQQVASTCVDAVVLLRHQDHDRLSTE